MISGASDKELDIAIARADVLLELQPKIDELKKENQQLKNDLEQSNAVADTNKELAKNFRKEIERLKSLLKCDYEDGQSIMAELTTENKQLKENNLAMQEEMARTWAKLQQKEDVIKQLLTYLDKNKLTLNNPNILDFYINIKGILNKYIGE